MLVLLCYKAAVVAMRVLHCYKAAVVAMRVLHRYKPAVEAMRLPTLLQTCCGTDACPHIATTLLW